MILSKPPASRDAALLCTSQVAQLFNVTPQTVRALAKAGALPHLRIGGRLRFPAAAVIDWVRCHTREG